MLILHMLCPHAALPDADWQESHLLYSRRPIPFRRIGPLDRVEVVGIPVECMTCHQPLLTLRLLESLEWVLEERMARGDVRVLYSYQELVLELMNSFNGLNKDRGRLETMLSV